MTEEEGFFPLNDFDVDDCVHKSKGKLENPRMVWGSILQYFTETRAAVALEDTDVHLSETGLPSRLSSTEK